MRMLHIVNETQFKIKEAHQPKILFEITLLKLVHMERTQKLDKLLGELEELKKKFSNGQLKQEEQPSSVDSDKTASVSEEPASNGSVSHSANTNKKESAEEAEPDASFQESGGTDIDESDTKQASPTPDDNPNAEVNEHSQPEEIAADYSNFFGEPSLGNGNASVQASSPDHGVNGQQATATQAVESSGQTEEPKTEENKNVTLQEVKDAWPAYVELLRDRVQQMLYFQMQRMEPIELKNRELTLRCADDFAKKILDENKKRLAKVLKEEIGIFLRMKCIVRKNEQEEEESKSPYERFKALQERDPKIKTLVELFGAELDYNLSH
jgi:DNA polymerase-3 subunit gamma/tau